jgi:ketosteroid isomerase-like protein
MPDDDTTTRSDLPAISAVIDAVTKAVRGNDVEAFLAHCAPEIVIFDMSPPLQYRGAAALRKNWALALGSFEGPIEYEIEHLDIHVSGDIAFSRSLARFGGTTKDGRRLMSHLRLTFGFRKNAGRWVIIHEHMSVPIDRESGQGLLDLEN